MFTESFEKVAELRSYPKHLDSLYSSRATDPDAGPLPPSEQDFYLKNLRLGYDVKHSPTVEFLTEGATKGLPFGLVAAIASPKGKRLRNAAALGGLLGTLYGLPKAFRQWQGNKLSDAHIQYHMDRLNYVPRK